MSDARCSVCNADDRDPLGHDEHGATCGGRWGEQHNVD